MLTFWCLIEKKTTWRSSFTVVMSQKNPIMVLLFSDGTVLALAWHDCIMRGTVFTILGAVREKSTLDEKYYTARSWNQIVNHILRICVQLFLQKKKSFCWKTIDINKKIPLAIQQFMTATKCNFSSNPNISASLTLKQKVKKC